MSDGMRSLRPCRIVGAKTTPMKGGEGGAGDIYGVASEAWLANTQGSQAPICKSLYVTKQASFLFDDAHQLRISMKCSDTSPFCSMTQLPLLTWLAQLCSTKLEASH